MGEAVERYGSFGDFLVEGFQLPKDPIDCPNGLWSQ